jgi:hypothetical protein
MKGRWDGDCNRFLTINSIDIELSKRVEFSNIINKIKETRNSVRLAAIADYSGKTRVVSIGTHKIQVLLKPYHTYMMKLLRCLPEDCS